MIRGYTGAMTNGTTLFSAALAVLGLLPASISSAGIDHATWPAIDIDPLIKENLARAYKAADDPNGGPEVAAAFTPDGSFIDLGKTFTGREVISNAITTAFSSGFSEQRHTIYAVFADQSPGLELMLRGNAKVCADEPFRFLGMAATETRSKVKMDNGSTLEGDFVAWAVIDKASYEAGDPKMSLLHVFSA
ncbi:hypothetical protein CORC01_09706 [Colletotrichum orchidophilum]|uniref:SnoaL-like domain-containing protein n=1 Tax=Colletotrichum orchidophilum TaxID=1209926 RepID=A0A1G4B0V3_9PEZI|nr:uncharacterized protein CORC01_09706 [Colletotrichum orchidophilum]OHE95049.1 hypothetical protein CORC01_09706 [Colletotrichum orchidophilum]